MSIDSIEIGGEDALGDILQLNDALERLGSLDKRKLDVVEMRFFGGLKESEIAEILSINEKTVRRDWQFAKVWLYQQLANE
jgi:RNA polymerase sigma factor (sigma-70 family)